MMRRPIVIILGLIVLIFVVLILLFGLKGPEMPIQEVHKVIPMSKFQQQTPTLAIPAIPTPTNNALPAGNAQQPIPAMPQSGAIQRRSDGNVGQTMPSAPLPQGGVVPTAPAAPTAGTTINNAPAQQSGVPLIIPQPNNNVPANTTGQPTVTPQQAIPPLPQSGSASGNTVGTPIQH